LHLHTGVWPYALIAVMIAQRVSEVVLSARHIPRVRALGGREYGRRHFPLIAAVHTLFPVALILEISFYDTRPGPSWPLWLGLWLVAQVLRYSAMRALGARWNVFVWVVPGMAPVRSGPYLWLRHPNYLAVVMEFIAAPMLFGAWRTAIVARGLNALALTVRIRCENRALQRAAVESSR